MAIVQKQNYIISTLRKNRVQAYQKDLQNVFKKYSQSMKSIMIYELTVTLFSNIWEGFKMQFIFQCLSEEQNEDQFAQLMYEIILKKYFIFKDKLSKVFAIFSLYFTHYSCENRKRINICPDYLNELRTFIIQNQNDKNSHYIKIAYQLHQKCINVCTKVGLRNPIIREDGEAPRKPPLIQIDHLEKIQKVQQQLRFDNIETGFTLKQSLQSYDKLKKQLIRQKLAVKDKFIVDTYFTNRVEKLIRGYKQFVFNNELRKKQLSQEQ